MESSPTSAIENWFDNFLTYDKIPQKIEFWLDTMKFLCERFGNPEKYAPCIHVAGSKGKGSVTEMISSILEASGKNCGLYQSPHVSDFRERICTAHGFFSDEIYKSASKEIIEGIEKISKDELPNQRALTWFELITLYSFLCFRKAKVDCAVYEVGLGGRLDATNVLSPDVCCITQIELEHTEILGDTIEKIAKEKAGIIKNNVPVIVGVQTYSEVYGIIKEAASEKNAPFYQITNENSQFKIIDASGKEIFVLDDNFSVGMKGKVQKENAALAVAAVKIFAPEISENAIKSGLASVSLPARFEIVDVQKIQKTFPQLEALVIDGAHTVNSIKNTLETLHEVFPEKKYHLLFGCASDKDIAHIVPLFKNVFRKITITKPGESKHVNLQKICESFANEKIEFTAEDDIEKAFMDSLKNASLENAVLLVAGSFYLAGAVKTLFASKSLAEHAC